MIPENKKTEPKRKYTEGKERDHFKYFVKYGEFLPPTKEEIKKAKAPSDWSLIYDSMTPIEKGQWNAEKRKRGMNGKTAEPLNQPKIAKPIKKKPYVILMSFETTLKSFKTISQPSKNGAQKKRLKKQAVPPSFLIPLNF